MNQLYMSNALPTVRAPSGAFKPEVQIKNCYLRGGRLYGWPLDYPEFHQFQVGAVSGHSEIRTSPVVLIEGDVVETERTLYHVQNWTVLPLRLDMDQISKQREEHLAQQARLSTLLANPVVLNLT